MTEKRIFRLAHSEARRRAMAAVADAPEGWRVTVSPPSKSRDQEERYHAMIGDIAKQCEFFGLKWHVDDVKRLLVDAFAEAMRQAGTPLHHDGRVIPSLDGKRVVQLGTQTARFRKSEASEFIEHLFAYGAERDVKWSNEERVCQDA